MDRQEGGTLSERLLPAYFFFKHHSHHFDKGRTFIKQKNRNVEKGKQGNINDTVNK